MFFIKFFRFFIKFLRGTVPHRKRQMDHVCHKNKCCQSYSKKQYNNTDFSPKNNNLGNTGSIATRKKGGSCCYGTSVAKNILFE